MILDEMRKWCRSLPHVTEDIKWDDDLVFSIGGKMFAVVMLDAPHRVSFKCTPEDFAELTERQGIIPARPLSRARLVGLGRRSRYRYGGSRTEEPAQGILCVGQSPPAPEGSREARVAEELFRP